MDGEAATFRAPIIPESPIPALLGRKALIRHRALLDMHNNKMFLIGGDGSYNLSAGAGTICLQMEDSPSGHSMLPVTEFHKLCQNAGETGAKPSMTFEFSKRDTYEG